MTRSILSLCSGIGGLELGLEAAGVGTVATQVELDPDCREVLARHWPHAERLSDLRAVAGGLGSHDVVCAGFPCQPVSVAGKRKAQDDPRWLWPSVARAIGSVQPILVVLENVPGLRTLGLRDVLADLARLGFDAAWDYLRAADVGAPHLRRRLFVCAWRDVADAHGSRSSVGERFRSHHGTEFETAVGAGRRSAESDVGGDADGVPRRLDAHLWPNGRGCPQAPWEPPRTTASFKGRGQRLKALGNAVVPQVAEAVGRWALACAGLEPEAA